MAGRAEAPDRAAHQGSTSEAATEQVILVDAEDREVGSMEKLRAHHEGVLHRAFSVFVFDRDGRLLLQRRAEHKYHSGGLWSNSCCGHPRPGEAVHLAARRRLEEEMGFTCELREVSAFRYRAEVGGGLVEHEFDHVFVGEFDGTVAASPDEVAEWRWIGAAEVEAERSRHPERFTPWFHPAWEATLPLVEK
jgi:isopentenyl-diphosphate Delta-isomerase